MKDWVDLGATQWFWTRDPWIGNPAPWPLGHFSCDFPIRHVNGWPERKIQSLKYPHLQLLIQTSQFYMGSWHKLLKSKHLFFNKYNSSLNENLEMVMQQILSYQISIFEIFICNIVHWKILLGLSVTYYMDFPVQRLKYLHVSTIDGFL